MKLTSVATCAWIISFTLLKWIWHCISYSYGKRNLNFTFTSFKWFWEHMSKYISKWILWVRETYYSRRKSIFDFSFVFVRIIRFVIKYYLNQECMSKLCSTCTFSKSIQYRTYGSQELLQLWKNDIWIWTICRTKHNAEISSYTLCEECARRTIFWHGFFLLLFWNEFNTASRVPTVSEI